MNMNNNFRNMFYNNMMNYNMNNSFINPNNMPFQNYNHMSMNINQNNFNNPMNITQNNFINNELNNNFLNMTMNLVANINLNNDNIELNIHLSEINIIRLQISLSKTIDELISSIKLSYKINQPFKLEYDNKILINSMTLTESGLVDGANIYMIYINEESNNNISNNILQKNNESPLSRYKKAAKTGLKNLGDTSYLNSVLQLLGTVDQLANYFLKPSSKKKFSADMKKFPMTYIVHRLNLHFYPYPEKNEREIYEPKILLDVLGYYNEKYKSIERKNPNELIEFCLEIIHKEKNKKKKHDSNPNHLNKEQVINEGIKNFIDSNSSIISDCFSWLQLKSFFCYKCSLNFYYMENFQTIKLDISGIQQAENTPLTITKCLQYQSNKKETIFCQNCQDNTLMEINSYIYSSPNFFIFLIERENEIQNINKTLFKIEKDINIEQFLENKNTPNKFELRGVISISTNENNKYVFFGKSPIDNKWYLYNDENVGDIDENQVIDMNQIYIPCILLYKSCQ